MIPKIGTANTYPKEVCMCKNCGAPLFKVSMVGSKCKGSKYPHVPVVVVYEISSVVKEIRE